MGKLLRVVGRILGYTVLVVWLAWTALTLLFSNLPSDLARQVLCGLYALVLVGLAVRLPRARRVPGLLVLGGVVTLAYLVQQPRNDRDWAPDVAVAATAVVEGDRAAIDGVRNFHYRSVDDFDERWERREYDLSKLRTLDLFMSYWGPVEYCHTILSFGFEGGEQLAVSVEVRNERHEGFSTWAGFFKRFELSYVFADERDLIGLRTLHRGEDVYLYRLRGRPEAIRDLLVSYLEFADRLAREPQFYDVLDNSCGVNILHRVGDIGLSTWTGTQALLNGYWDRLLYEQGALHQGLPFEELRRTSHVNAAALDVGDTPEFSARLRAGLPPAPPPVPAGD